MQTNTQKQIYGQFFRQTDILTERLTENMKEGWDRKERHFRTGQIETKDTLQ